MNRKSPSLTAQLVAVCRAIGASYPMVPSFSDPVAYRLLPNYLQYAARKGVQQINQNGRFANFVRFGSALPQFRTVLIDKTVTESVPFDQLVILGAGLDSRAWRMKELAAVKVFEVDHPATQSWKRQQVKKIEGEQKAKEVKFVSVDFRTDDLKQKLEEAGFEKEKKTFWIWEGVTMYLEEEDVKKTMRLVSKLSAEKKSALALTYLNVPIGFEVKSPLLYFLKLIGEPIKSYYTPEKMSKLAKDYGDWNTHQDLNYNSLNRAKITVNQAPSSIKYLFGENVIENVWIGRK